MSGTSLDGIDGVLLAFPATRPVEEAAGSTQRPSLLAQHYLPYSDELRAAFGALLTPGHNELATASQLGIRHSELSAALVNILLEQASLTPEEIGAIGSHGQTLRHAPEANPAYSIQIGNGAALAERTGITTVCDFRARDIAAGGQGAPLVPAFHAALFAHPNEVRAVVNIGGIANVTLLPAGANHDASGVTGFDTGPGNTLLDNWAQKHLGTPYDAGGEWAEQGRVSDTVLRALLEDPYFQQFPPKSTGREYFNLEWLLRAQPSVATLPEADVQAILTSLTAHSIINAINLTATTPTAIYLCGGGSKNHSLMRRLDECAPCPVHTTDAIGLPSQAIEAMAFAWLARQTLSSQPGNLPRVTGARSAAVLGAIYPA